MQKMYKIPQPLALALTTERVQFLQCLSNEELKQEDCVQLLRDLIEDRVKLRQQVAKVTNALNQMRKDMDATIGKFINLQDYLEGKVNEEEADEDFEGTPEEG